MSQVQAVIMTSRLWNSTNEDVLTKELIISHSIYIVQCLLSVFINIGILVVVIVMKQVSYNNKVNLSLYCFFVLPEKFCLWF